MLVANLGGCAGHACDHRSAISPAATETNLEVRLKAALRAKGPSYVPRTRHKLPDGSPKFTNRLILESSPYLLQHAHNPVDWFPWGEEAFERARTLGRPIFLSVGYSTCHWCHVMEEECFENEEVARHLNEHYVAIKVDREERPDVDAVYMTFVQALTGRGGWPMSAWLTPARDPFFGGTYFPPQPFLAALTEQAQSFAADPNGVAAKAREISAKLRTAVAPPVAGDFPSAAVLKVARTEAGRRFDPVMAGTLGAPKFPSSFPVRLLLRIARRANDAEARTMAVATLAQMRSGGIYDQLGGGFHRYSTDARWLVPHFEKMLYDNALLSVAYLEAGQVTGAPRFTGAVRETLDYLLRDMQAPDGTFYSATDADSADAAGHRQEGAFFTWTPSELKSALGDKDAAAAQELFGVTPSGQVDGRSVLSTERVVDPLIRARLLAVRSKRPPPLRDEKVIVSWNGLAVSAFARAAIVLGDARYADAATRAAGVLIAPFRTTQALPHVLVEGRLQGNGFSDDHVMLAAALLDVFELTSDARWLSDAIALMEQLERTFADPVNGGYYLTASTHEQLLLREKPDYDGPIPSVNSVAALTWLRLFTLTGDARFQQRAEMTMRAFSQRLSAEPLALDQMLIALDWATDSAKEVVIVVPSGAGMLAPGAKELSTVMGRTFLPNAAVVVATEQMIEGDLGQQVPWARDKKLRDGRATAYVCERGACKLPTTDPVVFAGQLAESSPYPP